MPFLIIFVLLPFMELTVFMQVGQEIGLFTTLLLAFLTAVIGGSIVRHQGLQTILSMRGALGQGKVPLTELFDGFCLVAAGAMLITPGFITDTLGFLLLVPQIRNYLRWIIRNHTNWHAEGFKSSPSPFHQEDIIEGEYESLDNEKNNP